MMDITQILFAYAQTIAPAYLVGTEYEDLTAAAEQLEATLRRLLPDDGKKDLEKYLNGQAILSSIENEAHFRAGLRIGMQLTRL